MDTANPVRPARNPVATGNFSRTAGAVAFAEAIIAGVRSAVMHIGIGIFPTDQTINPVELAREAETHGFESLWFPEHSHIPVRRTTPWGGRAGAPDLPEYYWRTHDPFVTMGACASVTTTLKLATGICLVAQRDPIHTAKEVASVDALSGGRLLFGIGYGWNKEEMAQHGTAYGQRRELLRENILAMQALWSQDEASFDGELVQIEPSWAWPKPVQRPHPPIILGGAAGPKTAAHIAEFCDGWMPIGGRHALDGWDNVVAACDAIDRDPAEIELGVFGAPTERARLEELAALGVRRAIFFMPQGQRDEVLAELERVAPLVEQLREA